MLTCYVTPDELFRFVPLNKRFDLGDDAVSDAIDAALFHVTEELRRQRIDPARVQIPLMLTGADVYARTTFTADTTGSATDAGNESRLVVDAASGTGTVYLDGAMSESGTFLPVLSRGGEPVSVTIHQSGIHSAIVLARYPVYRYRITTSDVIASIYMVDSGADAAIRARAIAILLFPYIDKDSTVREMYNTSMVEYAEAIRQLVIDVDTDEDDAITSDERSYIKEAKAWR